MKYANLSSVDEFPKSLQNRLRGIVNATVRHAVRPGFYADLNDPQVRDLVISEAVKHLVWTFDRDQKRIEGFITPDLSDEEFEKAFRKEQERIVEKERESKLREEEDRMEALYHAGQAFASSNVADEIPEITKAELDRARAATSSSDATGDEALSEALRQREERRKMIMSHADGDNIPDWLKHAVDTEDREFFPMASGRLTRTKSREDSLAEFFQEELDKMEVGSAEEAELLKFMSKFIEDEESGEVREESVEEVKKRVDKLLRDIEGNKTDS